MLSSFKAFIKNKLLFQSTDKVLLAVSGGIDSMVMVDLFEKAAFQFGIAHCNFQLRGDASDKDEQLVREVAHQLDVPFFNIKFDTTSAAEHYQSSIQMVARELRYQWLEDIRATNDFQYIATAHHLNDSLETVLYNFSKGCGIRGLHGIPVQQGAIIRPLLFATRIDILHYTRQERIGFREDVSNASTKYSRNKLRHEVIPKLEVINPSLIDTFKRTLEQLQEAEILFDEIIDTYKKDLVEERNGLTYINTTPILSHSAKATIFYEILSPYGFNATHIRQLLSDQTRIGAIVSSEQYELLKDRNYFVLRLKNTLQENIKLVKINTTKVIIKNQEISFQYDLPVPTNLHTPPTQVYINSQKIMFPLTIRKWKAGDRFQPLGMQGKTKKLQDYFSDLKLNRFEKEEVLILESKGKIVWVIGHRMDERFKVQADTEKVMLISQQYL